MCGGFVAVCGQQRNSILGQVAYHFGRLLSYVILGAVAGVIGTAINKIGAKYGITSLATYLVAGLLITGGVLSLLSYRVDILKLIPYNFILPFKDKIQVFKSSSFIYALLIGVFSAFLPCGWLYSYLAVAANSSNMVTAALIMFFFWLGTLPILILIGTLSKFITSPLKKIAPTLISVIMILAGIYSLYSHVGKVAEDKSMPEHCTMHHHSP